MTRKNKTCIICNTRKGKRQCPREQALICPKCCGETRTLDTCDKNCPYIGGLLKEGNLLKEIKKAMMFHNLGNVFILLEYRNTSGKWSGVVTSIDLWKAGYLESLGIKDVSKELVARFSSDYKEKFGLKKITWKKALYYIKRGLDIRRYLHLDYPEGYYQYKDIFKGVEQIKVKGTVYKCYECEGDLAEEKMEKIRERMKEEERYQQSIFEYDEEYFENLLCEKCELQKEDPIIDSLKDMDPEELFAYQKILIKELIENNEEPELTKAYHKLKKQGKDEDEIITQLTSFKMDEVMKEMTESLMEQTKEYSQFKKYEEKEDFETDNEILIDLIIEKIGEDRKEARKRIDQDIREIVENQLKMNKPKETAKTLERLIKKGYIREEAIGMIYDVVFITIEEILGKREYFNEKKFVERLKRLK